MMAVLILSLVLLDSGEADAQRRSRGRRPRPNIALFLSDREEIQEEIRLTEEQAELLQALQRDLIAQGAGTRQDDAVEIVNKLFSAVLRPKQATRFAELRVQFEGLRSFERAEIQKAIAVTDEQMSRIRGLMREQRVGINSDVLKDVLDKDQLAKWDDLAGERFAFSEQTQQFRNLMQRFERRRRSRPAPNPEAGDD